MFSNVVSAVSASESPVCALAVDAEEDFDWDRPVPATRHTTSCMHNIGDLQEVVGAYDARPTYLLTYPVLEDEAAIRLLRRQIGRGSCEAGVQLHPWVNPPFEEARRPEPSLRASFSGNLEPGLEARKLLALKRRFEERFGAAPCIYRAGRYGFGAETASVLEQEGFAIDVSLAPRTSAAEEGGPDFSGYDYRPFWFGRQRRLLELPLCRSIVGWGGRLAPPVFNALSSRPLRGMHALALVTRLRFAERITLSPEGNDVAAMLRLLRHLRAAGQTVFVLSFHSSSLAIGQNPYVRSRADLHGFYDRLSGILHAMSTKMGFRFATLAELPRHFRAPAA